MVHLRLEAGAARWLRDGKWCGAAADQAAEGSEGPSRPASHDTARPEQSEGQPQKTKQSSICSK